MLEGFGGRSMMFMWFSGSKLETKLLTSASISWGRPTSIGYRSGMGVSCEKDRFPKDMLWECSRGIRSGRVFCDCSRTVAVSCKTNGYWEDMFCALSRGTRSGNCACGIPCEVTWLGQSKLSRHRCFLCSVLSEAWTWFQSWRVREISRTRPIPKS